MLISSGQSEEYFVIERDIENSQGNTYGPVYVEKRKVALWEYGLFVIGLEEEYGEDLIESLQELCREENCLFLQVETIDYNWEQSENQTKYYKKFIPPYTALIDLSMSEDEILANMKGKGRYNIKFGRKNGVVIEQVDTHIWNIKKFYALMSETTARNNFAGNTLKYYIKFLESLDNSQMFFAYHEWEIIAAGIFIIENNIMTYYYWASGNNKRKLMPTYLLQWEAIKHAKKRWCRLYDFLWVAWDNEKNSSLSWVTDFKMRLSPKKILVSWSSLFIHKKLKYQLIMLMRKLRK